jgi:hypothetical protein
MASSTDVANARLKLILAVQRLVTIEYYAELYSSYANNGNAINQACEDIDTNAAELTRAINARMEDR